MPFDKPSLEQLIREHRSFVQRTLAQLGVPARDLPDAAQEVFRGADRGLPAFDPAIATHPETAIRCWLFGICQNQAASHRRTANRRAEDFFTTDSLAAALPAADDTEQALIDAERNQLLLALLSTLEARRRAVIVAYEIEGIPMVEVAAALAIPVNTAWNRLRLAKEDLRMRWTRMQAASISRK